MIYSNNKVNNINSNNISNNCPIIIESSSDPEEGLNPKAFIINEIISKSKEIGKKTLNVIAKINNIHLFNNENAIRKSELIGKNMSQLCKISLDINQNNGCDNSSRSKRRRNYSMINPTFQIKKQDEIKVPENKIINNSPKDSDSEFDDDNAFF